MGCHGYKKPNPKFNWVLNILLAILMAVVLYVWAR